MKSILVAIDRTEAAETAQELAIELARRHGAALTGIGILDQTAITRAEAVPLGAAGYKARRDRELIERERHCLSESLSGFSERCRVAQIEPHLLRLEGDRLEQLEQEATRHDLLVMGRDTRYKPLSEQDGTPSKTVEGILRDNPRPVIVTPPQALFRDSLLVVYDGRPSGARLLQLLTALNLHRDWRVEILGLGGSSSEAAQNARRAEEYLREYGVEAGLVPLPNPPDPADPVEAVLNAASECRARLVATNLALQKGWRRLFHGSAERRLLRESSSALFVYH